MTHAHAETYPGVSEWMLALRDARAKDRIAARLRRLANGNAGQVRSVGKGVSELKIDYGPGYRVETTNPNMNILFICSQNMLRSPTAEAVFSGIPGLEVSSAGTADDAETPISADLIDWADILFVMEPVHRQRVQRRFGPKLRDKRLVVLGIPDNYEYMDPDLIRILKQRVPPHLRLTPTQTAHLEQSHATDQNVHP